jgi:hypothetical protein
MEPYLQELISLMKIDLAVRECFLDTAMMPESLRHFTRCLPATPDYPAITRDISTPPRPTDSPRMDGMADRC